MSRTPPAPTPSLDGRLHGPAPPPSAREILPSMLALGTVLTAIVTPFDAELRVNEEAFVNLMRQLGEIGSDGFVVAGTTGEASTLSDREQLALIELAVSE